MTNCFMYAADFRQSGIKLPNKTSINAVWVGSSENGGFGRFMALPEDFVAETLEKASIAAHKSGKSWVIQPGVSADYALVLISTGPVKMRLSRIEGVDHRITEFSGGAEGLETGSIRSSKGFTVAFECLVKMPVNSSIDVRFVDGSLKRLTYNGETISEDVIETPAEWRANLAHAQAEIEKQRRINDAVKLIEFTPMDESDEAFDQMCRRHDAGYFILINQSAKDGDWEFTVEQMKAAWRAGDVRKSVDIEFKRFCPPDLLPAEFTVKPQAPVVARKLDLMLPGPVATRKGPPPERKAKVAMRAERDRARSLGKGSAAGNSQQHKKDKKQKKGKKG